MRKTWIPQMNALSQSWCSPLWSQYTSTSIFWWQCTQGSTWSAPHFPFNDQCYIIIYIKYFSLTEYIDIRCNEQGELLPEGSPPPPWDTDNGLNDWTPYACQTKFKLCDFLYRKNKMLGGQINDLLDIITAMNVMTGGEGPFTAHKDIYSTIDTTNLGDTPWNHFNLNYLGEQNKNPPLWQMGNITVWFHNPLTIIHNLLSNPDFNGSCDYSPFQ